MTITRKLVLTYILISILPTVFITLVSLQIMSNQFSQELAHKGRVSLFEAESFINNYFDYGKKIAVFLANSKELKDHLFSETIHEYLEAFKDFTDIAVVEVFNSKKKLIKRVYVWRTGTEEIFTDPEDKILTQTLDLKKISKFYAYENGLGIKVSEPIINTGTLDVMGAVIVSFPFNHAMIRYLKDRIKTDAAILFNPSGKVISTLVNEKGENITRIWEGGISDFSIFGNAQITRNEKIGSHYYTVTYGLIRDSFEKPLAILSTAINRDNIEKSRWNTIRVLIFSSGGVLFLVMIIGMFMARSLTIPISRLLASTRMITRGNLEEDIDTERKDELGLLAQGFSHMRDAVRKQIKDLSQLNMEIANKNEKLKAYRLQLEELVKERTSELHSANSSLLAQVREREKAEEKYRTIIENIEYGYYEADLEGKLTFINESILKISGYSSDELFNADYLKLVDRKNYNIIFRVLTEVKISKKASRANTCEIMRKDGEKRILEFSCAPVHSEQNLLEGFRGVVRDITESRQVEVEMQRARQAAEEANHAKSEFLANMSHEIRTPLNVLLGFSELLSSDSNDPRHKSYIEAMRTAGKSLLTLINDILDLSKIEAGKITTTYEPVNLNVLFGEIEYIFKEKIAEKGIRFIVDLSDDLPAYLILDETRIRQILLNLVGNAVKFTEKGWIKLTARKQGINSKDTIGLVIEVEDTAHGIEKKELHSIFDSFKQGNGQINRRHGGTGLGLTICKKLIEAMNGQISVISKVGFGTTFSVSLKNVKILSGGIVTEGKNNSANKIDPTCFEKKKIMIVDDFESSRFVLRELLIKFNQDVLEAGNGQQAIEMAKEHSPDIIIMDILMPGMSGDQATEKLKIDPATKKIPVIAFTGNVVAMTKTNALKKGYDGFLAKPIKIPELISELSKYLKVTPPDKDKTKPNQILDSLVKENVLNPDELILILHKEILPLCRSMEQALVMGQIEEFGYRLHELGVKYKVQPLSGFSQELIGFVTIFDVTSIKKKFQELPGIIEHLTKLLENRQEELN